jgi:Spy/CpxP family protein refolding chaperone
MNRIVFSPFVRGILVASALGLGVVGCGSTTDQTEAVASPESAASSALTAQASGPGGFFLKAVESLSLRADQQQTVAAIRTRLYEAHAPVRAARAKLDAEVVRQVRAGAIDHALLQPLADQVAAAVGATKPAMQQAVQQIHDTLDAAQRTQLVTALRDKVSNFHHIHDRAAQFDGKGEVKGHMARMATDLALTDDQRTAIHAQLHAAFAARSEGMHAEHVKMKARLETLAAAFESDTFDAKALDVGEHGAGGAMHMMGAAGTFLDAAVPVLTPAQREVLVTKIQAHAQTEPVEE